MHVVYVKFNSLPISGLIFVDWPKIDPATVILSSSNGLKSHLIVGYFSFLRAIQVLYYYSRRHKKCIESTMVVYRRRLSNFDTIKNRRMSVDEEIKSSLTSVLRFFIDYKMNELYTIDWKQHHYSSDGFSRSEHNIAPIKKLS